MLDVDGWKKQFKTHTARISVEHVVGVIAKRRLFLVPSVTPNPTLKIV